MECWEPQTSAVARSSLPGPAPLGEAEQWVGRVLGAFGVGFVLPFCFAQGGSALRTPARFWPFPQTRPRTRSVLGIQATELVKKARNSDVCIVGKLAVIVVLITTDSAIGVLSIDAFGSENNCISFQKARNVSNGGLTRVAGSGWVTN